MNFRTVGSVVFTAAMLSAMLTAAEAPAILTVDGVKIAASEIELKQGPSLFQARNNYFQAERKAVEEYVDVYLQEREAKKGGFKTFDEMLEATAYKSIPGDPSDEALRFYYEGLDAKEPFEKVKPQILEHIRNLRKQRIKTAALAKLKADAKISYNLTVPRAEISLKETPGRGPANAKVAIVEYADFECPYCQQIQPALDKLEKEYGSKIAFYYKDTPLPMHANAQKAAEAAHCAEAQGKYWEYHDHLYKSKALGVDDLKAHARTLKLDGEKFDACLDSNSKASVVKAQLDEGMGLKIEGTPSFFINGRFYQGNLSFDELKSVVEEELSISSKK
jgi:protein-disulfide isomerase